jgi:hypothetical protein
MNETLIIRDFHFSRDFRKIKWGATIWYNLLRASCAGLVFGIIMFLSSQSGLEHVNPFLAPLIWPLSYLFFYIPMGIILSFISPIVPFSGLMSLFLSLISVTAGDPLVCLIDYFFPEVVPVESPPLFSFDVIIFVLDAPELIITK